MLCPHCSQEIPDGDLICPECGRVLSKDTARPRNWPPLLIMGILFAFGLILYFITSA